MMRSPLICNLWHIKQTNGLFYYALDYLRALERPSVIYVRPALLAPTRAALPDHRVEAFSVTGLALRLFAAMLQGRFIFTPTPHPFPFLRRQLVVVHDDFPFLGKTGKLKRRLFEFGLHSAHAEIGYINHSTSLDVLPDRAALADRLHYMPNKAPDLAIAHSLRQARLTARQTGLAGSRPTRIALFGSDSPKKRYDELFEAVRSHRLAGKVRFAVFGHPNAYFTDLRTRFPDIDVTLVESSMCSLEDFFAQIDVVASVALHEGFGRPIALALSAGIPCFLLDSAVFREFFGGSTRLHDSINGLVDALAAPPEMAATETTFAEQTEIAAAFDAAVARLDARFA